MKQSGGCLTMFAVIALISTILGIGVCLLSRQPIGILVSIGIGGMAGTVIFWALGDAVDLLSEIAVNGKRTADALERLSERRSQREMPRT